MQKNKKHLYNFRRVLVTCFREITLVTSSRPTHRSAQCHWSQSSYSCRCMRSWDWRKLPLKEAQQRKIRNKVELEQNIYNTPTNMPLVGKLCMNNIKWTRVQPGHDILYSCIRPQTMLHQKTTLITTLCTCSSSRWMTSAQHKYAQKQGAYRMTLGRSIFCSTPNAFCGYFGSWPFQTVQSFHCS